MPSSSPWGKVIKRLEKLPQYAEVEVPRDAMPSPLSAGMHPSYGEIAGQERDYRKSLPGNRGFHVRQYSDKYTAHIDSIDVDKDIIGHVIEDSPTTAIVTSAVIGAGLAMFSDCKRDAMKGAIFGSIAAVIALVVKDIRNGGRHAVP